MPSIGFPTASRRSNSDVAHPLTARTVVISANAAWNLLNFRSRLIRALVADGYDVVGAAPSDAEAEAALAEIGCRFRSVAIDSKGVSPWHDLRTTAVFDRVFAGERPFAYLGYTVKPNVYGSLAAARRGVPTINNVSGLGTAFIEQSWLTPVVEQLYRAGLKRSRVVFFQNEDDATLFTERRLVRADQVRMLPGSGVDLARFMPVAPRHETGDLVFLMIARVLRDKGVVEFVDAARACRAKDPTMRFRILGFLGAENRTAIPRAQVDQWVAEGTIEYLGAASDVRPHIAAADCVVLPSYREGTSRVLLEAAAMARPLVATDVPGCREVVDEGVNGFLCKARDSDDLARAMEKIAAIGPAGRAAMGKAGRQKVVCEFDEQIVIDAYRDALADIAAVA